MRRAAWLCGLALLLLVLAGCSGLGPPQVPEQRLNETRGYDWNATADATYTVTTDDEYRAVLRVEGPRFVVSRTDGMGTNQPVRVRAVAFRYPNGTIRNGSQIGVRIERRRTVFRLPNASGQLAFAADSRARRFHTPVLVDGSHTVVLPRDRRVSVPIAGRVSPPTDNRSLTGRRVTLRWDDLDGGSIDVRYYLPRDLGLFGALVGGVGLAALVAAGFVRRELRELERQREAAAFEEPPTGDDDSPPGSG